MSFVLEKIEIKYNCIIIYIIHHYHKSTSKCLRVPVCYGEVYYDTSVQ